MPAITQAAKDYDAALQQMASNKAMKSELELQKLQNDMRMGLLEEQKASEETPKGKANKAAELTAFLEQQKQQESGIPIGEQMGARMIASGGPGILEASRMQGELDVESRMRQARVASIENSLAGEKSLLPTANIDLGGVKQTVLASEAGRTSADIYKQVFTNQTPQLAEGYIARGYDRDTAIKMAAEDVQNMLVKERSSGKVTLMSADGFTSRAISDKEAMTMWRDPKTPKVIREQLNSIYGQSEEPQAASWIKSRLGR